MSKSTELHDRLDQFDSLEVSEELGDDYLEKLFNATDDPTPINTDPTDNKITTKETEKKISGEKEEDFNDLAPELTDEFIDKIDQPNKKNSLETDKSTEQHQTSPSPGGDVKSEDNTGNNSILEGSLADFAKELYDYGILTLSENEHIPEIKTTEDLVQQFHDEKKKGAVQLVENILSNFGEEYREAFNAIYLNGVNPAEYFTKSIEINDLEALDLSIAENQKSILQKYYKEQLGWDQNKIASKLEKLENYQDLEEEARDIHQTLLSIEKKTLREKEQQKKKEHERKLQIEAEHNRVVEQILQEKNFTKNFGFNVEDKIIKQVKGYILEKKWQLGESQISDYDKDILDLSRPENVELQVKIGTLLFLLKTDKTLSRLQKNAVSQETNNMFRFLQRDQKVKTKDDKPKKFFED